MSTAKNGRPTLYIVACGGRAGANLAPFVAARQRDGWTVCVVATPSALKFIDVPELAELTGYPVRSDYKQPDEPDVLPPPDALVVAPATFNTINKWAHGISDTLALGLLNEAIGLGLPAIAVPTPSTALAKHPAFRESIARLRAWGVHVLFEPDLYPLPIPNMGTSAANLFPWKALADEVNTMLDTTTLSAESGVRPLRPQDT